MRKDITKIRIGNDIRLSVDLRQYIDFNPFLKERKVYTPGDSRFENLDANIYVNKKNEVYYPNPECHCNDDHTDLRPSPCPINIRSVKAILVNTSRQMYKRDMLRKKTRFISRFPIEPYVDAFHATPYDVCNSGYATWRAYPHRHIPMPYHGYGWRPWWNGIYKPIPEHNDTEFVAPVYATEDQHVVEVSFPAKAQLFTGVYKLVIVAKVYAPGFNHENLKTITVDTPDVFELVKTSAEEANNHEKIVVHVDNAIDILPGGGYYYNEDPDLDRYVVTGEYNSGNIALTRSDGEVVGVDMSPVTEWYEGE